MNSHANTLIGQALIIPQRQPKFMNSDHCLTHNRRLGQ